MPSEHRHSLLNGFRNAWNRRRPLAPVVADVLAAALVTACFVLLAQTAAPRAVDGMTFDLVTRNEAGRLPKVIIIENEGVTDSELLSAASKEGIASIGFFAVKHELKGSSAASDTMRIVSRVPASKIPASSMWRLARGAQSSAVAQAAPALRLPDSYGVRRQMIASVPGNGDRLLLFEPLLAERADLAGTYLVRMPEAQNIPRITARQLVEGNFAEGELTGLTAIVAPGKKGAPNTIATPLDPGGTITDDIQFSAHAVQTLLDRREVRVAGTVPVVAAILAATLFSLLLFGRSLSRPGVLLAIGGGAIAVAGTGWLALQTLNLVLPITAMLGAFLVAAAVRLARNNAQAEKRIEATIERAIDLAFNRSLFHDNSQLLQALGMAASVLGLPRAALMMRDGSGKWSALQLHGAQEDEITLDSSAARNRLKQLDKARKPLSARALVAGWSRAAIAASLPDGDSLLLLIYDLPASKDRARIRRILTEAVARMRAMRHWQHRLLVNQGLGATQVPLERRMQSAANLITVQGDELAKGLDALDTGVFVFRPLGVPVHANAPMAQLLELAGMVPARTTLIDAITGLTELEIDGAQSMMRDVLLHGEEMRVPMRELGARQRILRLGLAGDVASRAETVLVLEAIDITELDQLAELRLAVGTFIDRQLRNDLEAISLGASLARDPRLQKPALERIVDRIADVAKRASNRLEEVRDLLEDEPLSDLGPCYPIEARKLVAQAIERAEPFAQELDVTIEQRLPAISGFSIAEPLMLSDMIEAMLRLIVADTAQGGVVEITLDEADTETMVTISGGFGLPFDRFCAALDAGPGEVPAEYQIAAAGMAQALQWKGAVSYWSSAGGGFRFNIRLRRIG